MKRLKKKDKVKFLEKVFQFIFRKDFNQNLLFFNIIYKSFVYVYVFEENEIISIYSICNNIEKMYKIFDVVNREDNFFV